MADREMHPVTVEMITDEYQLATCSACGFVCGVNSEDPADIRLEVQNRGDTAYRHQVTTGVYNLPPLPGQETCQLDR